MKTPGYRHLLRLLETRRKNPPTIEEIADQFWHTRPEHWRMSIYFMAYKLRKEHGINVRFRKETRVVIR